MITVEIHEFFSEIDSGLSRLISGVDRHILLCESESVRLERYTAYYHLSRILSEKFKLEPSRLSLDFDGHGRPYLLIDGERCGIDFSISHSGTLVLVAVSDSGRIGADLQIQLSPGCSSRIDRRYSLSTALSAKRERIRLYDTVNTDEVAELLCGVSEKHFPPESCIGSGEKSEFLLRELDGTELWATAEAALKCDGRGFSAYSHLEEILSSMTGVCTSFVRGEKKYAVALTLKD